MRYFYLRTSSQDWFVVTHSIPKGLLWNSTVQSLQNLELYRSLCVLLCLRLCIRLRLRLRLPPRPILHQARATSKNTAQTSNASLYLQAQAYAKLVLNLKFKQNLQAYTNTCDHTCPYAHVSPVTTPPPNPKPSTSQLSSLNLNPRSSSSSRLNHVKAGAHAAEKINQVFQVSQISIFGCPLRLWNIYYTNLNIPSTIPNYLTYQGLTLSLMDSFQDLISYQLHKSKIWGHLLISNILKSSTSFLTRSLSHSKHKSLTASSIPS